MVFFFRFLSPFTCISLRCEDAGSIGAMDNGITTTTFLYKPQLVNRWDLNFDGNFYFPDFYEPLFV
jgi:hypothetical protein